MNAIIERPATNGTRVEKTDVPDPVAMAREVGQDQEWTPWQISQNLTDRWGDINRYEAEKKPLAALESNPALLERLRQQMWEEETFVVRKDGKFGILYEVEFCSRESEEMEADTDAAWFKALKPHEEIVSHILESLTELALEYPGVQFAVPEAKWIINDRPAAWAYVPDGLLSDEQRNALGTALLAI